MQQFNTVTNTLFSNLSDYELHNTLDTFCSEYTNFNHKKDPFNSDELIRSSKYVCDGNSNLWHQKYSLPYTKVIGFLACRVT